MERSTRALNLVAWGLSVLLAVIFLLTGVPKILGIESVGLQAAAMRGFPGWIRVVTGIVEVVAAIGLLVPRLGAGAASVLALLMIPAFLTQRMSGEPGLWIPPLLFVLLLFVAWARNPEVVRAGYRALRARPHPLLRDGIAAGLIGAAVIAVWFLGIDLLAGRPLFTPATLGNALLRVLGPVPAGTSEIVMVLSYTVFHVLAFVCVGLLASLLVQLAGREPSLLLGFVVLFVAFEVGFYALVGLLQQASTLGELAWYQVMGGNLIAAIAMGAYLWRAHPALKDQLSHAWDVR